MHLNQPPIAFATERSTTVVLMLLLHGFVTPCYRVSFTIMSSLTVIFLSFRTDRLGKQCLIRLYVVCNSLCIFWTHYSKEKPSYSTFRVIITNILGVRIFRKFTGIHCFHVCIVSFSKCNHFELVVYLCAIICFLFLWPFLGISFIIVALD